MNLSNQNSLMRENYKIVILIWTIFFHLVLIFQENISGLFNNKITGNFFLTIFILMFFIFLFIFERFPVLRIKKTIYIRTEFEIRKAIKLFLFFAIPITLFGILIRVIVIQSVPIDPKLADMLPLIQKANTVLLFGQTPYQVYYFPYPMPLTFWPGLWLPFLPATLLGFDPRWIGLIIWGTISILLIKISISFSRKNSSTFILFLSSINIFLLQTSINLVSFHGIGHTYSLWLWLVLLAVGIIDNKNLLTAIALGLVISSRQTSLIFIPILMVFWYRKLGLRMALRQILIAFTVFCFLTLPFIIRSPYNFIIAPILHYQQLAKYAMSLGTSGWTSNTIGFSYLIQEKWGEKALSFILGLAIIIISAASIYMTKKTTRFILFLASSVTFFSFFTPIPWTYEYYPALILLSLSIIT